MAILHNIDNTIWQQHVWHNRVQTILLLAVMELFLALLGWLLWGPDGILTLLLAGLFASVFNQNLSPWLVMRMYGAIPLRSYQVPELSHIVAQLTQRAELPVSPTLYYIPSRMINAFAIGTDKDPVIAMTDGLMRQLTFRQITGVLAHEIGHIKNNDLRVMGMADLFSRMTSLLSLMGQTLFILNLPLLVLGQQAISWFAILLLILAPTLSALMQLALSRTREFNADLSAVALTKDPDGLASALAVIEQVQNGWFKRALMPGRGIPEPSLLRTHPLMEERIKRLMMLKPHITESESRLIKGNHPHQPAPHDKPVMRKPRWHITGLWH